MFDRNFHGFPYKVVVTSVRDRIAAMAAVRRWRPDLNLRAAQTFVRDLPAVIVEDVSAEDARRVASDLVSSGVDAEAKGPEFNRDPMSWLLARTTVEEQERESARRAGGEGEAGKAFGGMQAEWHRFKAELRPGDELWTFSTPALMWQHMVGRAGLALLRDGEIVASLITSMN